MQFILVFNTKNEFCIAQPILNRRLNINAISAAHFPFSFEAIDCCSGNTVPGILTIAVFGLQISGNDFGPSGRFGFSVCIQRMETMSLVWKVDFNKLYYLTAIDSNIELGFSVSFCKIDCAAKVASGLSTAITLEPDTLASPFDNDRVDDTAVNRLKNDLLGTI